MICFFCLSGHFQVTPCKASPPEANSSELSVQDFYVSLVVQPAALKHKALWIYSAENPECSFGLWAI